MDAVHQSGPVGGEDRLPARASSGLIPAAAHAIFVLATPQRGKWRGHHPRCSAGHESLTVFSSYLPISSEGGDVSFQNNVPDPVTSGKELPIFKFELERSEGRVMGGSYGKGATVAQLPISKAIAGVSTRMEPGVMRKLHWHATAAEWAFVTEGRVRTTSSTRKAAQ
jgi:hypothetical protein